MKIAAQEEYGLRLLVRLAQARQPLTIPELSESEGLSQSYVAKLLTVLKQGGLVESERGRVGGNRLGRPAGQISLLDALALLGEPLYSEAEFCLKHAGTNVAGSCVHQSGCGIRAVWSALEDWTRQVLDKVTLADLLQGEEFVTEQIRQHLLLALRKPPLPISTANLMELEV